MEGGRGGGGRVAVAVVVDVGGGAWGGDQRWACITYDTNINRKWQQRRTLLHTSDRFARSFRRRRWPGLRHLLGALILRHALASRHHRFPALRPSLERPLQHMRPCVCNAACESLLRAKPEELRDAPDIA